METHEQIAACAKQIWISKGCPIGKDMENWEEAKQILFFQSVSSFEANMTKMAHWRRANPLPSFSEPKSHPMSSMSWN